MIVSVSPKLQYIISEYNLVRLKKWRFMPLCNEVIILKAPCIRTIRVISLVESITVLFWTNSSEAVNLFLLSYVNASGILSMIERQHLLPNCNILYQDWPVCYVTNYVWSQCQISQRLVFLIWGWSMSKAKLDSLKMNSFFEDSPPKIISFKLTHLQFSFVFQSPYSNPWCCLWITWPSFPETSNEISIPATLREPLRRLQLTFDMTGVLISHPYNHV